jgi:hypothetical protein
MAVLALGFSDAQPLCATGTPEAGKSSCCAESPACNCHPDKPCKPSCSLLQTFDKQVPARTAFSPIRGGHLVFSTPPIIVKYPVFTPVISRRASDSSPPFGGGPPQAMLSLWLI